MTGARDGYAEFFHFVYAGTQNVYLKTDGQDETLLGQTYTAVPIGRSETDTKGDINRQNMTISLPMTNENAITWYQGCIDNSLTVTIRSSSLDGTNVEWKGRLTSIAPQDATFDFVFESVFTSLRRAGLRQPYQITCPFALYGEGCDLNMEDFDTAGTVTNVTGPVITVTEAGGFSDGYFNAGIFKDNAGNLRMISSHVGTQITLIRTLNPLVEYVAANGYTGLTCTLYPGCNRTSTECDTKFNNILNYGGFPYIPFNNPFDGGALV